MENRSIKGKQKRMSFRESLRSDYKAFEEKRKLQKEAEKQDYSELDKELQRKFDELFGDDEE